METVETKKVFISYSWSDEEHKIRVLELAKSLMGSGVEVVLDVWDLKVGQDKYDFMEKMIKDESIDRVLIISDKVYSEKADGREGGVGTETQIITPAMYDDLGKSKFIPIIFERNMETGEEYLPLYAKGRMYIDLSREEVFQDGFERLLREIFDKPDLRKPKIGKIPSFILEDSVDTFEIERKANLVEKALDKNAQRLSFAIKEYLECFIEELEKLSVSVRDGEEPDEAAIRMIHESQPFRKSFSTVISVFVQDNTLNNIFIVEFFEDFNNQLYYLEKKGNRLSSEAVKFLLTELFIVANSIFVKYKRWDIVSSLVNHSYFDENRRKNVSFYIFRHPTMFIFEGKLERESKRISLTADLMKERSTEKEFKIMLEIDMLLYFISKINPIENSHFYNTWFPLTYIYLPIIGERLSIVSAMKSRKVLEEMLPIFGISESEFVESAKKLDGEKGYSNSWESIPSFKNFIDDTEIGTTP
ncbi:toll/interleukin-1 receptor domain-containing protein [Enterococcus faecalis]|uniref:toll/interleukin-1 receptor domain-containing protein n=1 Tax=Enterococcus faecalis TaxID=1351 RepID=UPI0020907927|nr:toll/interleukin-1 receptor domain-containing protein [Enterococcus faecalis]MCO5447800.1 toll/interleukin-1 receptor domain-containing protein [Enterococcus faecalis]